MTRRKSSSRLQPDLGTLCQRVLLEQLERTDDFSAVLRVPQLRDHVMEHPGLHFHFHPDLVIGLRGRSRFEFIHESFVVEAGALAIIPGGIPHREVPLLDDEAAGFENLVISVYNETVSVQLQTAAGRRLKAVSEYFDTVKHQQLTHYLEEIGELHHGAGPGRKFGARGLLLIYLTTLLAVIQRVQHAAPVEKLKISQTRRLVQEHLGEPNLGVTFLAGLLHCSGDYLSNFFHRETGQRLAAYINRERIRAAMTMLGSTPLTIAEVAYAVGYESQGYFSRVFRQIALKSPMAYRRSVEHSVVQLEGRPRTVYAAPNAG